MCGISAIISNNPVIFQSTSLLFESLRNLQNRGYDSSGIILVYPNSVECYKKIFEKKKSPLQQFEKHQFSPAKIQIGHNRWATHGAKSILNAHPHHCSRQSIFLVHNGIIENFEKIRYFLIQNGFSFYSQTDTEIIVKLLEYYETLHPTMAFEMVIQLTTQDLIGTFALIIYNTRFQDSVYCIRRGSPLLVSCSKDGVMICSEQSGFGDNFEEYIVLSNDDIVNICFSKNLGNFFLNTCKFYEKKKKEALFLPKSPHPYPHWTLREIYEQPHIVKTSTTFGGRLRDDQIHLGGLYNNKSHFENIEHVLLLGCGTSFHSCLIAEKFFKTFSSFTTVCVIDGGEFSEHDLPKKGKAIAIFISQSGETHDLQKPLHLCKSFGIFSIGIVNVPDSLIAREVDCGVYCYAGREIGVASTKSFTSQVICCYLVVMWFVQNGKNANEKQQVYFDDLLSLSNDIETTLDIVSDGVQELATKLSNVKSMFLLGKGFDHGIAMEASLKIKEICYIHCESYSLGTLKHGPFALLEQSMPVILIHTQQQFESKILSCYEEIVSRGSPVYVITPFRSFQKPNTIYIPENKTFSFLLAVIPFQLLAYHIAIQKDIDPDTPRNLAKVVTVE